MFQVIDVEYCTSALANLQLVAVALIYLKIPCGMSLTGTTTGLDCELA